MKWFILIPTWAVVFVTVLGAAATFSAPPAPPSCRSDWTLCKDNSDMVNNYKGWFDARYACKLEATDRAKYGTPEWPSFFFSHFYPGTDFSTGFATLIEPKAKFQNGFGAMAHSQVVCRYDLRTKQVIGVNIS